MSPIEAAPGPASATSPAIGAAATTPLTITPEYTKVESPRIENTNADPERVHYGSWVPNPQSKAAAAGAGSTCGASNAVTPIPAYLPSLVDMEWAIGIVSVIVALLADEDEPRVSSKVTVEHVNQIIDNNDFLPTTLDDFTNRVVGTGVNT